MEQENEGNVFHKVITLFTRYPGATVSVITVIAFVLIGLIVYAFPQFGSKQSLTAGANSPQFDLPSEAPQSQGSVQGASTQQYGPVEKQPTDEPSSDAVSEAPTASDSAVPTETPTPSSSPPSAPTATPQPTSTPAPTAAPTVIPTATPAFSPTPTE